MAHFPSNAQIHGHSVGSRFIAFASQCLRVFLPLCLCITASFAQTPSKKIVDIFEKANKAIVEKNYERATGLYDEAIRLDSTYAESYFKKAQLLELTLKFDEALPYYRKSVALSPDAPFLTPAYQKLINYHIKAGEYTECKPYLAKYMLMIKPASMAYKQAQRQLDICIFGENAVKNALQISPEALSDTINQFDRLYFPSLTADNETLIFTVLLTSNNEDLFVTKKINGAWSEPKSISTNINTEGNEGAGSISGDGRTLVFTACNRLDGYGSCDLYISKKNGETWDKPKNLGAGINTAYRERQPSLSADGRTLYFISDRAKGIGGDDIWFSNLQNNGQWTASKNLGNSINTPYDEVSPFIHANGHTLFFASEGHENLGGYDLFMSDSTSQGWSKPQNLGYPINTAENQVSMVITADGDYGYYTRGLKNESESKLYRVALPESIKQKFIAVNSLKGLITDAKIHKPLQANIELIDLKTGRAVSQFQSDMASGQYLTVLPNGGEWGLYVSTQGYYYKSLSFDFTEKYKGEGLNLNVELEPLSNLNKGILNNIYFETGKAELQEKSRTELNQLIYFLQKDPTIKIEIAGHTDDVGDAKQNLALSLKRAQSVADYLLQGGIVSTRIKAVGYGETQPVVPNTSEENRQLNRRIEWRIQ